MQRGVYFDAWFPRQHCYHPSLPPRRLRMLDDLVDYRATTLVWAALGGGALPAADPGRAAAGREPPPPLPGHGPGLGGAGRRLHLAAIPGAGGVRTGRRAVPVLRLRQ